MKMEFCTFAIHLKQFLMKQLLFIILICTFALPTGAKAQVRCHYEAIDSIFIEQLLKEGNTDMLYYARRLSGRYSVAHMPEVFPDDERLVINTRQFDCTTFVEFVAAMTLCARHGETTFGQLCAQLQRLRYWNGICKGYTSRKLYFSDWIRDNSRLGLVKELHSPKPPFTGIQTVKANYMTQHPDDYLPLKLHPDLLTEVARQEKQLSGMQFRYIPKEEINNTELMRETVHDGDIMTIVTQKPGLDVQHLSIAVWRNNGLHMFHASSLRKKVTEESIPLRRYLDQRKSCLGIRVIRLAE